MFDTLSSPELIRIHLHTFRLFTPLCPLRLPRFRPHPFHIHPVLLPPPIGYPWTWYLLRRQTQVHNGPVRNELCDCVLAAGDIGLQLLQPRFRHRFLQRGVYPHSVPTSTRLPPCHPAVHHVVKSSQHPPDARRHHPCL